MTTRREFLGALSWPAAAAVAAAAIRPARAWAPEVLADLAATPGPPDAIAREEAFWFEVQQAFPVDRSLVNFNNGGVCPSPAPVLEALKRHLDFANGAPAYRMWQLQDPQKESVREGLARLFGSGADEIAVTRNASESLQILENGLDLKPGDEIVTTNQDYPRMITTWKQRERRDHLVLKQISIPTPCEDPAEIVRRFEAAMGPRTRVLHCCHVINLTGQVLPVKEIVALGRRRGIPTIVDGAHAFAHLTFTRDDLDCDFYGVSLHKWLLAPIGTGLLYVQRDRIKDLWAMQAAGPDMDGDIKKFEEIGTHPAANFLAIAEALSFHNGIGSARKEARLRYLRERWATRLLAHDRVKLHTSLKPQFASSLACVQIEGVDTGALNTHLWTKHRIFTVGIKHDEFEGLRVSPNVYSTLEEIDRFAEAMEDVLKHGLPKA